MNKKGFTLVELIGVIALLAAMALIAVPIINKTIERSKEKSYRAQIDAVIQASKRYVTEIGPKNDSTFTITFNDLITNKLIEKETKVKQANGTVVSDKIEVQVSYETSSKSYIYTCYIIGENNTRTEC